MCGRPPSNRFAIAIPLPATHLQRNKYCIPVRQMSIIATGGWLLRRRGLDYPLA